MKELYGDAKARRARRDAELPHRHYRTVGDGSPLVLVHGSGTDLTTWDGVVDELAHDHQVIASDRRGYGESRHQPVRDHRIHARDLVAVLEQPAGRPADVVGWSSGGNIALAAAVQSDRQ